MNLGNWGHLFGVVTVILMIVFVGIWYWAWRPRHRRTFERLATMPLEDLTRDRPDAAAHGHAARGRGDATDEVAQGRKQRESKPESTK
jgi:cytochrome c oxidase cbb3-type subunit 4